jgi:hypothetical protein
MEGHVVVSPNAVAIVREGRDEPIQGVLVLIDRARKRVSIGVFHVRARKNGHSGPAKCWDVAIEAWQ